MECVTQMITKCKKKIIIHTNSKICIYYYYIIWSFPLDMEDGFAEFCMQSLRLVRNKLLNTF